MVAIQTQKEWDYWPSGFTYVILVLTALDDNRPLRDRPVPLTLPVLYFTLSLPRRLLRVYRVEPVRASIIIGIGHRVAATRFIDQATRIRGGAFASSGATVPGELSYTVRPGPRPFMADEKLAPGNSTICSTFVPASAGSSPAPLPFRGLRAKWAE